MAPKPSHGHTQPAGLLGLGVSPWSQADFCKQSGSIRAPHQQAKPGLSPWDSRALQKSLQVPAKHRAPSTLCRCQCMLHGRHCAGAEDTLRHQRCLMTLHALPLVVPSLRTRPEHAQFGGQHPPNCRVLGCSGHPGLPEATLQILSMGFAGGNYFTRFNRIIFTGHLAPLLAKILFYF